MPVSSVIPVSDNPARIAVSVNKTLKTNSVLRRASFFSLNWLDFKNRKLVEKLSKVRLSKTSDKLKSLRIPYEVVLGVPVLKDSLAYMILEKEKIIDVGDHNLFIGRVQGAMASLDFDEYWKFKEYNPILYLGSGRKNSFVTL
jgi:flavin reductase (DIM6/NTAB) family NADH-FMN oxidoreductase RutF